MSRVRITRQFKHAVGGIHVVVHHVGAVLDAGDPAAKTALAEKWGELIQAAGGKKTKRRKKE